jgi:glycosyltransferase involved in cell wall biosynthesis
VRDGVTGRLVASGDDGALATGLGDMLAAPELLRELGTAARAEAEARLGLGPMIDRTAELYERVLSAPAPRRRRRA